MYFNKKGQAAMEFLMTYGWAILVVIISITSLAYFGVLSPGKLLPRSCIFEPGISCGDSYINTTNFQIAIRNGMGVDITIHKFNLTSNLFGSYTTMADMPPQNLSDGQEFVYDFQIVSGPNLTVGARGSFEMRLDYTKSTSDIMHVLEGRLVDNVHKR